MTQRPIVDCVDLPNMGDPDELVTHIPYMQFLGLMAATPRPPDQEALIVTLPYRSSLIGNAMLPAIHGGVLGGLMEATAILQLVCAEQLRRVPKIVDTTCSYMRPARPLDTHASCEVLREGRRTAIAQVRCWQDNRDRVVCTAQIHLLFGDAL